MRRLLALLCACWLALPALAQISTDVSNRVVALTMGANGLEVGELFLADATRTVNFTRTDNRIARVDVHGLLRFSVVGSGEGVYTFAPSYDGYGVGNPNDNKIFVADVRWSPNGEMLAFIIAPPPNLQDVSDGLWYWQPARETSNDPSYQLLREYPEVGTMVSNPANIEWQVTSVEWGSDNRTLLVGLNLPKEGRTALTIRTAARDSQLANIGATPIRYDYGVWAGNGQIVVSGMNPDTVAGFGLINTDGTSLSFTPASALQMAWVQHAVQGADGNFYMFANTAGKGAPVMLIDGTGKELTPLLGGTAPSVVEWNPERTAVRVVVSGRTYIVQLDGTVTDITPLVNDDAIAWAVSLPSNAQRLLTPEPIHTGGAVTAPKVGDILRVREGSVVLYSDPVTDSPLVGALNAGEEFIVTSDPVSSGDQTWYRVQGITYGGWINTLDNVERGD